MPTTDLFEELPGSPVESGSRDRDGQAQATRMFQCDWGDRYTVRDYFFEYDTRQYEYDTSANLWAMDWSIEPIDPTVRASGTGKQSTYQKAKVTIEYKYLTGYSSDPDGEGNVSNATFVTQNVTTESQLLSITSGDLYWDASQTQPLDDGQAPEKLVQFKNYAITWHNVTTWSSSFDSLIGTVNVAAYEDVMTTQGLFTATRTGNFLYEGYNASQSLTKFGTSGWNVTFNFKEIKNGESSNAWNYFFNPDTQEWSRVYDSDGNAVTFYETADWTNLALPPKYVPA